MAAAHLLGIKKRSGLNTGTALQSHFVKEIVFMFTCHAHFMLAVRTRLSSTHKQLTSCVRGGSVSDKEQHCGLHSGLPACINHCQDAWSSVRRPLSWVLRIISCKMSKELEVPNKELYCLSFPKMPLNQAHEEVMRMRGWLQYHNIRHKNYFY